MTDARERRLCSADVWRDGAQSRPPALSDAAGKSHGARNSKRLHRADCALQVDRHRSCPNVHGSARARCLPQEEVDSLLSPRGCQHRKTYATSNDCTVSETKDEQFDKRCRPEGPGLAAAISAD
ncbi:hypothetical protein MTO96_032398 [Rhipicephalus appendiculatus]